VTKNDVSKDFITPAPVTKNDVSKEELPSFVTPAPVNGEVEEASIRKEKKEILLSEIKTKFLSGTLDKFEYIGNVEECMQKSYDEYSLSNDSFFSSKKRLRNGNNNEIVINKNNTDFKNNNNLGEKWDNGIWISFATLYGNQWLSSDVICKYCEMLNDRELALWKTHPTRPKSYFINNWLITKVKSTIENSYEKEFANLNIFNFDQLFICVNLYDSHWVLIRVDIKKGTIECLDSIKCSARTEREHQRTLECIADWLKYEKLYHDNENLCQHDETYFWQLSIVQNNLKQTDGFNCGIHMLIAAYFLSDFDTFDTYDEDLISNSRLKIAVDIYKGYIEDPRISDKNDYYFIYKSYEYDSVSLERKKELENVSNSKLLKDSNDNIMLYFRPSVNIMDDEVDMSEYLPDKQEIEIFDLTADEDIAFVMKAKKRKQSPVSSYLLLQDEITLLKTSNKVYKKIVDKMSVKRMNLEKREKDLNKREEDLLKREMMMINER
jgi:hypothetical protein